MSENVQIVTIVCTLLGMLGNALIAALFLHLRDKMSKVATNVQKIEVATNSMKDALVKATGDAAFLAGEKSERLNPNQSPGPSLVDPSRPASDRPST